VTSLKLVRLGERIRLRHERTACFIGRRLLRHNQHVLLSPPFLLWVRLAAAATCVTSDGENGNRAHCDLLLQPAYASSTPRALCFHRLDQTASSTFLVTRFDYQHHSAAPHALASSTRCELDLRLMRTSHRLHCRHRSYTLAVKSLSLRIYIISSSCQDSPASCDHRQQPSQTRTAIRLTGAPSWPTHGRR
jgi:hypothetical protein